MFMDQSIGNTSQINLQIQCNPYRNSKCMVLGFFFFFAFAEMNELILKFIWKCTGPQNSQDNLEKEELRWRTHPS